MKIFNPFTTTGGAGSLTFSQGTWGTTAGAVSTVSLAYTSNVTAGNLLLFMNTANSTNTFNTPTDTLGNTWVSITTSTHTTALQQVWWCIANGSGANTVTCTIATGGASGMNPVVAEFTVAGSAPTVDGYGSGSSANATTVSATSSSASGAADLVLAFCINSYGGVTNPSGYTQRVADTQGGGPYVMLSTKTASGSGTQSATFGCTQNSLAIACAIVVNFQPGSGSSVASSANYVIGG